MDVTEAAFANEVLQADGAVIVDFWAEWCGPCRAAAPVVEALAEEKGVKLVKVNIDEEPALASRYGVMSIPAFMLFRDGAVQAQAVGAMPKGLLAKQLGL